MPNEITLRTTIVLHGKSATGFVLPEEEVMKLEHGKRIPVYVTIGDFTYRSTVVKYSGEFMLPLNAENREAAGVSAGDEVDVHLRVDTDPREIEIPEDLAEALSAAGVRDAFDKLSYSHRKEHVRSVEDAKKPETRLARIEKTISMLKK